MQVWDPQQTVFPPAQNIFPQHSLFPPPEQQPPPQQSVPVGQHTPLRQHSDPGGQQFVYWHTVPPFSSQHCDPKHGVELTPGEGTSKTFGGTVLPGSRGGPLGGPLGGPRGGGPFGVGGLFLQNFFLQNPVQHSAC